MRAEGRRTRSPPRAAAACGPPARSRASARSGGPTLDLLLLQLEPVAVSGAVRPEDTAVRLEHAVEEHRLNSHVVVEILEMAKPLHGAECVRRDRGRTVRRQIDAVRVREAGCSEETGDAPATRDVGLQHVDGADQIPKIARHVRVFAGRYLEARGPVLAQECEAGEVGRRHGLLEPAHVPLEREALRPRAGDLCSERAVRVDEKLDVVTDSLAGGVETARVTLLLTPDLQ